MADVEFPKKLSVLFEPHPYKVLYGGRLGVKSWSTARALLILAAQRKLRILCAREIQKSIKESVHHLLVDQAQLLGLGSFYTALETEIRGRNGSEFIFAGLRTLSVVNLKSFEGCDICWVEEAANVSKRSWGVLIPTIRKAGSEIWVTFNPDLDTDDTYQRWVVRPPKSAVVVKTGWQDNRWLTDKNREEMDHLRETDPDEYEWIYEGACRQIVEGAIFRAEILAAEKAQRFTSVPYEPNTPVYTFWDLGFGDNTSIWFVQSVGHEFRLIDFVSDSQKALGYYLEEIKGRPYTYAGHYLPHDAKNHELSSGRTIEEQVRSKGYTVRVVPRVSIANRIEAARSIFASCFFDADKCADGIQALRHYRYEVSEKLGTLEKEPMHDWASHPADAFTYFAMAIKGQARPEPEQHPDDELALMSAMNERDQGQAPSWNPVQ